MRKSMDGPFRDGTKKECKLTDTHSFRVFTEKQRAISRLFPRQPTPRETTPTTQPTPTVVSRSFSINVHHRHTLPGRVRHPGADE